MHIIHLLGYVAGVRTAIFDSCLSTLIRKKLV